MKDANDVKPRIPKFYKLIKQINEYTIAKNTHPLF